MCGISPNLNRYFGENNLANYENDEVSNTLNEIKDIKDTKLLENKYMYLQDMYVKDRPYIGLCFNKITIIYNKNLGGIFNPTWYNPYNNIDTWYWKNNL